MNITGFDSASAVPAGTTIESIYYANPAHYGTGERRASMAEALAEGIDKAKASEARHDNLVAKVYVDVRWVLRYPTNGTADVVAQRYQYDTVAEAERHLTRINEYARH